MKTLTLPDGSFLPLVRIKNVFVEKHFWSQKYYVDLQFRNGTTQTILAKVPHDTAVEKRNQLMDALQQAYEEQSPFEDGYDVGQADGYSRGHTEGFASGHGDGYEVGRREGYGQGRTDDRNWVLMQLSEMRESMLREQHQGELISSRRRHYLGHTISVLTNVIHALSPEPVRTSEEPDLPFLRRPESNPGSQG